MSKEVYILDVDDVLLSAAQGFTDISNQRWGTNYLLEDYTENWPEWWNCTTEECQVRNDIIWGEGLPGQFKPVAGANEGVTALAGHGIIRILTSRPVVARAVTEESLLREFGDVFDEIIFAGFFDNGATSEAVQKTKADLVRYLGGTGFIEDHPKHCNPTAAQGVDVVMFGDYHWQRGVEIHPRVTRRFVWPEVIEHFNAAA